MGKTLAAASRVGTTWSAAAMARLQPRQAVGLDAASVCSKSNFGREPQNAVGWQLSLLDASVQHDGPQGCTAYVTTWCLLENVLGNGWWREAKVGAKGGVAWRWCHGPPTLSCLSRHHQSFYGTPTRCYSSACNKKMLRGSGHIAEGRLPPRKCGGW